MDHKEVMELLPAYVDKELGISDAIAVERHLDNCSECQQEYALQSGVSAQLKKMLRTSRRPPTLLIESTIHCLLITCDLHTSQVGILTG